MTKTKIKLKVHTLKTWRGYWAFLVTENGDRIKVDGSFFSAKSQRDANKQMSRWLSSEIGG
jgi:hypothetical protein